MLTKPNGPIFGASEDVAPTSPPTTLKYTRRNKIDSKLKQILQKSTDIEGKRHTEALFFISRPWHDVQAIACTRTITCANQKKGDLHGQ